MKNKHCSFSFYTIGLFLLFATVHCYVFRPGVFYNRYIFAFTLYFLFYILLAIIAVFLIPKLNSMKKFLIASFVCPYILAGTMGSVFYAFNPSNICELFAFAFYAPYIGMGCYIGTIPFLISCFLYNRNVKRG